MIFAVSLLALVAMATAFPANTDPNRCCLPDKFEMNIVDIRQFGSGDMEVYAFTKDFTAKKTATISSKLVPGQPSVFKYRQVFDYNLHKMYTILPDNSCYTQDFPDPLINCIPKDTPVLASSYVGEQSLGETFEVFRLAIGAANFTMVIDKDCIPIAQYFKGKFGEYDVDTTQFISGFKAGNSDPTVYNLPPTCK